MSTDPNEFLLSGNVTSIKFARVGDSVTGTILRQPEIQQTRDFATGALQFWDDGKPKNQLRVVLQTDERDKDDPDDTGERALFIKSGMKNAIADAVRAVKAEGLEVGGLLWVKYHGDGEAKKGMNPPKLYQAKYKKPAAPAVTLQEAGAPDPNLIGSEAPF